MKIILSRKGFDSTSGGYPSPIMPDDTLLSLPIPNDGDNYYESLLYNGKNYAEIINDLTNGKGNTGKCHYDPDIREGALDERYRPKGWRPAFGQKGSSLSHLQKQGVNIGDIFLFFGLFREAKISKDGKYRFVRGAQPKHIIWGYMQVGDILDDPTAKEYPWLADGPNGLHRHPHLDRPKDKPNAIFIGTPNLSWDKTRKGADCLQFDKRLILTKEGMSASCWDLPEFFKDIELSYHSAKNWRDGYFKSAGRGQEFVFSADDNPAAIAWLHSIIGTLSQNT